MIINEVLTAVLTTLYEVRKVVTLDDSKVGKNFEKKKEINRIGVFKRMSTFTLNS